MILKDYILPETYQFLFNILCGVCFGLFYEAFRFSRLFFSNKMLIIIEDAVFFSLIGLFSFYLALKSSFGYHRVYLIIGQLIGFILYYFTFGILFYNIFKRICIPIRKKAVAAKKHLQSKAGMLYNEAGSKIKSSGVVLYNKGKKIFKDVKTKRREKNNKKQKKPVA